MEVGWKGLQFNIIWIQIVHIPTFVTEFLDKSVYFQIALFRVTTEQQICQWSMAWSDIRGRQITFKQCRYNKTINHYSCHIAKQTTSKVHKVMFRRKWLVIINVLFTQFRVGLQAFRWSKKFSALIELKFCHCEHRSKLLDAILSQFNLFGIQIIF